MEDYAIPRPANPYQDDDENSIPKYVNVGRSVESELRYIAFREERERETSLSASQGESDRVIAPKKYRRTIRRCLTGEKGRCTILVVIELVTLLVSLSALALGAICISKLSYMTRMAGMASDGSAVQSLLMEACLSNTTVCDAMNNSDCSVTIIPQNATVRLAWQRQAVVALRRRQGQLLLSPLIFHVTY